MEGVAILQPYCHERVVKTACRQGVGRQGALQQYDPVDVKVGLRT